MCLKLTKTSKSLNFSVLISKIFETLIFGKEVIKASGQIWSVCKLYLARGIVEATSLEFNNQWLWIVIRIQITVIIYIKNTIGKCSNPTTKSNNRFLLQYLYILQYYKRTLCSFIIGLLAFNYEQISCISTTSVEFIYITVINLRLSKL